jgi:hypothetical protein
MSRIASVLSRVLMFGAMIGAGVACGPEYDRMEFSGTVKDDFGGTVSVQHLTVHEGMIVKSHIVAWNDDKKAMPLLVRVGEPDVIELANVISDRDYAFIGRKPGPTRIDFEADGVLVLVIEAEVVAQPKTPE